VLAVQVGVGEGLDEREGALAGLFEKRLDPS
jgi:hypothetical protein